MSKNRNSKPQHIPLPDVDIPMPTSARSVDEHGNKLGRGFTPAGWTKRANKFTVQRDRDGDLVIDYKGRPCGVLNWQGVLEMGIKPIKAYLQSRHKDAKVSVKQRGGEWVFRVTVKRDDKKLQYTYKASEYTLLLYGLDSLPKKFALKAELSHDKLDMRPHVKLAIRRQVNYIIWQMWSERQRSYIEERLSNVQEDRAGRGRIKMPA